MPAFLAFVGVGWVFVGAFIVLHGLALGPVQSVLQQQYVTMEIILGAMLCSFGMLMIGLGGVIDALRPPKAPTSTPQRMVRGELVRSAWS
jgi:hypothetical protein